MFWRAFALSEARLAQLPWVIVAPMVGALVGTSWALSEPAQPVRDGHVVGLSFWDSILPALGGGVAGALGMWLGLYLYAWVSYRLFRDPVWKTFHVRNDQSDIVTLVAKHEPLPDKLRAQILTPDGYSAAYGVPGSPIWTIKSIPEGYFASGVFLELGEPAVPGEYECRWYCEQGRFTVELTRGRFDVPPLTTNVSDLRQPDVDV